MEKPELLDRGIAADISHVPEKYLEEQGGQFGADFEVLVICNLVFHEERVLLLRMTDQVKAWRGKVGVPTYRLARDEDGGMDRILNLPIDMKASEDISVQEVGRVACHAQIGLNPARLEQARAATALHTAVSPALLEDSLWLRASLLWNVKQATDLVPDQQVCHDWLWATELEVQQLPPEAFFLNVKDEIITAFVLLRRASDYSYGQFGLRFGPRQDSSIGE